jgi:hypothetical protein
MATAPPLVSAGRANHPAGAPLEKPLDPALGRGLAWLPVVALAGIAWLPWMANPAVRYSLLGAAGLFAVWLVYLLKTRSDLEARIFIRRPHWIQTITHSSIYAYWGWHVDAVYPQVPLILAQVVFVFGLDLLLSWSRKRSWLIGFGPIPITGSTNLFLWFQADLYYLQLLMMASAFLSREFLRWRREGFDIHIFNPSGFALGLASVVLIATGSTALTHGSFIATTLGHAPYMYEWLFCTGILVQVLFGVNLVTMCAALTVFGGSFLWHALTGSWPLENDHIPIAVFLGMHLLITDPSTSPTQNGGKALFGVLYGLAVFPLYWGLLAIGTPSFYDKLIQVPILNLLVPLIERVGRPLRWPGWKWSPKATNLLHIGIWSVLFFTVMREPLKNHPGNSPMYWEGRCGPGDVRACQNMVATYESVCRRGVGPACLRLGDHFMEGTLVPAEEKRAAWLYEQGCKAGTARACGMLALAHEAGKAGLVVSNENAAVLRTRACELGDAQACVEQAARLLDGRGLPRDPQAAAALLESACQRGLAQPCGVLGFMLERGQGIPADGVRARALYDQACRGGFEPACRQRDGLQQ